jgi:hypothetical protein
MRPVRPPGRRVSTDGAHPGRSASPEGRLARSGRSHGGQPSLALGYQEEESCLHGGSGLYVRRQRMRTNPAPPTPPAPEARPFSAAPPPPPPPPRGEPAPPRPDAAPVVDAPPPLLPHLRTCSPAAERQAATRCSCPRSVGLRFQPRRASSGRGSHRLEPFDTIEAGRSRSSPEAPGRCPDYSCPRWTRCLGSTCRLPPGVPLLPSEG